MALPGCGPIEGAGAMASVPPPMWRTRSPGYVPPVSAALLPALLPAMLPAHAPHHASVPVCAPDRAPIDRASDAPAELVAPPRRDGKALA